MIATSGKDTISPGVVGGTKGGAVTVVAIGVGTVPAGFISETATGAAGAFIATSAGARAGRGTDIGGDTDGVPAG
jgi:hypothetical protein